METVIPDLFTGDYKGVAYFIIGVPAGYMVARLQPRLQGSFDISERMKTIGTILLFINTTVEDAILSVCLSALAGIASSISPRSGQ